MHLYIENKPAIIKAGTNVKLIRENSLLSSQSDRTFDVTLPLYAPENQRIFGPLQRLEISKRPLVGRHFPFRLLCPPEEMAGTAVITSITEEEVKLQLLSGRYALEAAMLDDKGQDRYIDELPLGRAWDLLYNFNYGHDAAFSSQEIIRSYAYDNQDLWLERAFSPSGRYKKSQGYQNFVAFPIYATGEGGGWANEFVVQNLVENKKWTVQQFNLRATVKNNHLRAADDVYVAPQPYLCYVIERVLLALGFYCSPAHDALRQCWLKDIFIANARATLKLHKMLPHWTVREFFEQCRLFLGIYFTTAYDPGQQRNVAYINLRRNRIKKINQIDQTNIRPLHHITSAFSYSLEDNPESEEKDITRANVSYAFPDISPLYVLPDEVWENANIVEVNTYEEMEDYKNNNEKKPKLKSTLFFYEGLIYAYLEVADKEWDFTEVDKAGARRTFNHFIRPSRPNGPNDTTEIIPERNINISLKIVPAQIGYFDIVSGSQYLVGNRDTKTWTSANTSYDKNKHYILHFLTADTRTPPPDEGYCISDTLLQKEKNPAAQKRDIIEVGYNPGKSFPAIALDGTVMQEEYPRVAGAYGLTWYPLGEGNKLSDSLRENYPFSLKGNNAQTIATETLNPGFSISTKAELVISFTDEGQFSPEDIYLIQGRRYLCRQLEFTFSTEGLNPLKKGYFYEIE